MLHLKLSPDSEPIQGGRGDDTGLRSAINVGGTVFVGIAGVGFKDDKAGKFPQKTLDFSNTL